MRTPRLSIPVKAKAPALIVIFFAIAFAAYSTLNTALRFDFSIIRWPWEKKIELTVEQKEAASIPQSQVNPPGISDTDYVQGNRDAEVTIIEYSDLECPYCRQNQQTMTDLQEQYPGKIARVFRNLPLASIHPGATEQAKFALCVAEKSGEDAYFQYIQSIFANTNSTGRSFSTRQVAGYAALASKVSADELTTCSNSQVVTDRLNADLAQAASLNLTSTPSSFIITKNGTYFAKGAYPIASYQKLFAQIF